VAMDTNFTLLGGSGLWFSYQHYGLTPDIVTMAKVTLPSFLSLLYPTARSPTHPPNHTLSLPAPTTAGPTFVDSTFVSRTHAHGGTRGG